MGKSGWVTSRRPSGGSEAGEKECTRLLPLQDTLEIPQKCCKRLHVAGCSEHNSVLRVVVVFSTSWSPQPEMSELRAHRPIFG
ncbi:hypothetical protein E2C01_062035 [Portunus trituberculatus]|uniref:Uncharacterized protein n=1 Tax=Portunus trituberculatus TaxID=210409 RepID=A0A5B7HDG3_PORTR|nr:hypothetical protein [Portunus trituberculatus]